MVHFDSTVFGRVTINGKKYGDVLIVDDKVVPRDKDNLRKVFGTSHEVSKEEVRLLLKDCPQVVIIGTGQSGVLLVSDKVREKIENAGAELIVLKTPEAIKRFNELYETKIVNALVHTTC